ncbi:MAG: AAA family ATPase [Candidatus Doudnabacteria bacterium]|nr:AAA family ATPase [Candidatus Doudnabacteria bacterium]
MYLKRLELHGFKSFAQKAVLDFDPGLTAIVGPNGSGKSNVADAIRWVMGEQSLKLLRGKKSEDVIFAGSDKKSKLSMAEVSLYFDNKDHKLPYDYNEVVIARRLYRNGESEYLINKNRVRLLDVVDALLRSGFGATNYAVIGQGTIDQLVLAGPAEIKNLIEDASGVKPYYLKKEKTIRRLAQTEENLTSVSQLIAEIEPRLRSLKRQAKRMEEREAVAAQLAGLQLEYFGGQIYLLETELDSVSEALQLKKRVVAGLESEITAFQKNLEKDEQQSTKSSTFVDELDSRLKHLEDRKLALLEQLAEISGKLKIDPAATRNFSEFQRQFEAILNQLRPDNIEEVKRSLKKLVSDFSNAKNDELLKQKQVLTRELEQIVKDMEEQRAAKNKLLTEEKQKKQFLTAEEKKFRTKSNELNELKDEQNLILIEKAKLDTRMENLTKEIREAFGGMPEMLSQHKKAPGNPDLPNQILKFKRQLELAGGVDEQVLNEYRETQQRFDYLSAQVKDLSAAVADLKTVLEELDLVIKKQFDEAFSRISDKFAEYFRILFNGGKAHMNLLREDVAEVDDDNLSAEALAEADNDDQTEEPKTHREIVGIEIKATPPGKKLATIQALSGGERALTAIALLCALLASYPSPFVVLDEVDAALDEANSIRFASILGTLAHQTQFITITHNRETMRQAHTLYGVTMDDAGVSKILSIKLEKAEAIAE